ncbi:hypothetical protein [Enterocloster lavalensis]|uniref:hypothetical protein n=1 Tax=Enterocloster lavalensis TaxID=460384 RepID=UPI0023F2A063|nr:hypothetical protein [Enterocloster lavalensis]
MSLYDCSKKLASGIRLQDIGSFHVGGEDVEICGRPAKEIDVNGKCGRRIVVDPNGIRRAGQMYAQYFIPETIKGRCPLLLWHGGGMTGKAFETTPDGRPGWLNYFIRCGWKTYLADAVERGRSGWCPEAEEFKESPTLFNYTYVFERFRLGASYEKGEVFENSRFPINSFRQYAMQFVPRWTESSELMVKAYCRLLERTGPSVIVAHSQGATLAFEVMEKRPELVKALIAVEPYGAGRNGRFGESVNVPVLWVFGDYTDLHPAWKEAREVAREYCGRFCRAGGDGQILDLPEMGIRGNSHMLMMEYNNFEIADLLQDWLIGHGLTVI